MPTLIRVSVSRKLSKDFQSQGFSLDITSELPSIAVENPQEMADASSHLFQLAEDLLAEQVSKADGNQQQANPAPQARQPVADRKPATTNRYSGNAQRTNGNGSYRPQGNGQANGKGGERPITEAQVKAIQKMATKLEANADTVCQEDFGKQLRQMSIKEASACIDNLKSAIQNLQPQGAN